MNNSREALDQAKQVSCNGQRHGDGQRHGGIRRDMSGYVETKEFGWKMYKVKKKHREIQGHSCGIFWGTCIFFQININLTCFPNMFIKPVLKPPSEAFAACRG